MSSPGIWEVPCSLRLDVADVEIVSTMSRTIPPWCALIQLAVVCHQRSTKRMWGRYRSRVFKKGKEAASHQSYWFQLLCEASDWFVGVSVKQQPSSHRWRKWIQLSSAVCLYMSQDGGALVPVQWHHHNHAHDRHHRHRGNRTWLMTKCRMRVALPC